MQLLLHGERRGIAMHYVEKDGYLAAVVRDGRGDAAARPRGPGVRGAPREARERAAELGQKSGLPEEVVQQVLAGVERARAGSPTWSPATSSITPAQRQTLLETLSVEERLRRVLVHVQRQIAVLDAQEDIKSQVQEELGERQREMFLREQLKAIQKELGEDDEPRRPRGAAREARRRSSCPRRRARKSTASSAGSSRIGRESMESQVIRTYLETDRRAALEHAQRRAPRPRPRRSGSSTRTTTPSAT